MLSILFAVLSSLLVLAFMSMFYVCSFIFSYYKIKCQERNTLRKHDSRGINILRWLVLHTEEENSHHHDEDENNRQQLPCASATKIDMSLSDTSDSLDTNDFNFIMNFSILQTITKKFSVCPECKNPLSLNNNIERKRGFSLCFDLWCDICQTLTVIEGFETSTECDETEIKTTPGRRTSSVNIRSIIAFREFGKGYAALETFARCMNMPKPITKKNYNAINDILHDTYTETADESTSHAVHETIMSINAEQNNVTDCQVSLDGTWQKRGHASINGVVTLMSRENGKCLDTYVFAKVCKGCQYWEEKTSHAGYNEWKLNHKCLANHDKSSGAMESAGAVKMFARSINKNNLRYASYIGDGDTSSFNDVVNSKPYGDDVVIDKKECIGHVQKRMGTRLRTLRQSKKGMTLDDGKKMMGKGSLTDKSINTIQNYYGMAIRQNCENVYTMKKCVWAVLYHNSNIDRSSGTT